MRDSRRYRGALGLAATWGVALSVAATASLAVGLATGLVPSSIFGVRELVAVAVRGFAAGAVAGGIFGWLLSKREQGSALSTLSVRRVATWGFVAAAAVPAIMALAAGGPVLPLGILGAAILGAGAGGSLLAVGTLRVARRADAKLLAGSDDNANRLLP